MRLAELAGHDMVMLDLPPSRSHFTGLLAAAGVVPRVRHSTPSFEMVRSLVARGRGFALLIQRPAAAVSYEGLPLVSLPLADPVELTAVVLARPQGATPTRRAAAFAEHCRTVLRDGPPGPAGTGPDGRP